MATATLDYAQKIDQIVRQTSEWPHEAFTLLKNRLDSVEKQDDDFQLTNEEFAELERRNQEMKKGINCCTLEEMKAMAQQALKKHEANKNQ